MVRIHSGDIQRHIPGGNGLEGGFDLILCDRAAGHLVHGGEADVVLGHLDLIILGEHVIPPQIAVVHRPQGNLVDDIFRPQIHRNPLEAVLRPVRGRYKGRAELGGPVAVGQMTDRVSPFLIGVVEIGGDGLALGHIDLGLDGSVSLRPDRPSGRDTPPARVSSVHKAARAAAGRKHRRKACLADITCLPPLSKSVLSVL